MSKKTHDLIVKVGEYNDSNGEQKARWLNVGAVVDDGAGGSYILMERHFNPAGVWNPEGRTNITISMKEPDKA